MSLGIIRRLCFILLTVGGLTACKDDKPAESINFYEGNAAARTLVIERCETQDAADADADCVNARQADRNVTSATERKSFQNLFDG